MEKSIIISSLISSHQRFVEHLEQMDETAFLYSKDEKWTPGQHLAHIISTVEPVKMAMGLPLFIVAWRFGKANRPSRSYEDLVSRYKEKLALGGKAPARFVPQAVTSQDKGGLIIGLKRKIDVLVSRIEKKSEAELDEFILPHPLLGKITLREMVFFTIYHAEHHLHLILRDSV